MPPEFGAPPRVRARGRGLGSAPRHGRGQSPRHAPRRCGAGSASTAELAPGAVQSGLASGSSWSRTRVLRGYLELLRPANVVTAVADVLAGYAVAGRANHGALPWLLGATVCLYAGGIVLNDFFDRRLDAIERPERPIPSGRVPASSAAMLGGALLAAGAAVAAQATLAAALIAIALAALIVLYDARLKRYSIAGPLNMGLC